VDGQPADLLRANVAFRAIAVPAGRHHIEMRYRPVTLPWSLVITGVALAAGGPVAGRPAYFLNSSPRRIGPWARNRRPRPCPPGPDPHVNGTRAIFNLLLNS